jgi:hypothetical protein
MREMKYRRTRKASYGREADGDNGDARLTDLLRTLAMSEAWSANI